MRGAGIAVITALLAVGACGSSHQRSVSKRTTSTSSSAAIPTIASGTSVTTNATMTTVTTSAPQTTLTTAPVAPPSTVHIDSFTADQPSPVSCNAPTMIELKWTTRGAARVEMHIDGGGTFASYPNGTQDQLLPLTCDGRAHTYQLVAIAGPERTSKTLTIATKLPS